MPASACPLILDYPENLVSKASLKKPQKPNKKYLEILAALIADDRWCVEN